MSKFIDKIANKLGYYKPVSDHYYTEQNGKGYVVDYNKFKENHKFNYDEVKEATKHLLYAMGEDIKRPGLLDTPRRVAGYWQELLEGEQYTNKEIAKMNDKCFVVPSDSLVVLKVGHIFSTCEHHLALMYNGEAYIAYIPKKVNGGYKVIGLSKIPRIVNLCAKRLQLQEKIASDIAECISLVTESEEIYVQLIMNHGCVSARGAKSVSCTDVTHLSEKLKKNKSAREEIEMKIALHHYREI